MTNPNEFRSFKQGSNVKGTQDYHHLSTHRNSFSIVLVLLRMTLNFSFLKSLVKARCSGLLNRIIMPVHYFSK